MKDRIRQIRKSLDKSQADFAKDIGVSFDNIKSYELGRRTPSDAFIKLLCNKYGVNEVWLRTGEGEPYEVSDVDRAVLRAREELKDIDDSVYKEEFLRLLQENLSNGTARIWYEYAKKWIEEVEKKKPPT